MSAWLAALTLSLCVEVPVYLALVRVPWGKRWAAALGTTLLTHPYAWFVLPVLLTPALGYWGYVVVTEACVVVAEAGVCLILGATRSRAFLASALANALSYAAGLLLLS